MKRKMKTIETLRRTRAVRGSAIVGNVRDVEIMISGARSAVPYYDVILANRCKG